MRNDDRWRRSPAYRRCCQRLEELFAWDGADLRCDEPEEPLGGCPQRDNRDAPLSCRRKLLRHSAFDSADDGDSFIADDGDHFLREEPHVTTSASLEIEDLYEGCFDWLLQGHSDMALTSEDESVEKLSRTDGEQAAETCDLAEKLSRTDNEQATETCDLAERLSRADGERIAEERIPPDRGRTAETRDRVDEPRNRITGYLESITTPDVSKDLHVVAGAPAASLKLSDLQFEALEIVEDCLDLFQAETFSGSCQGVTGLLGEWPNELYHTLLQDGGVSLTIAESKSGQRRCGDCVERGRNYDLALAGHRGSQRWPSPTPDAAAKPRDGRAAGETKGPSTCLAESTVDGGQGESIVSRKGRIYVERFTTVTTLTTVTTFATATTTATVTMAVHGGGSHDAWVPDAGSGDRSVGTPGPGVTSSRVPDLRTDPGAIRATGDQEAFVSRSLTTITTATIILTATNERHRHRRWAVGEHTRVVAPAAPVFMRNIRMDTDPEGTQLELVPEIFDYVSEMTLDERQLLFVASEAFGTCPIWKLDASPVFFDRKGDFEVFVEVSHEEVCLDGEFSAVRGETRSPPMVTTTYMATVIPAVLMITVTTAAFAPRGLARAITPRRHGLERQSPKHVTSDERKELHFAVGAAAVSQSDPNVQLYLPKLPSSCHSGILDLVGSS